MGLTATQESSAPRALCPEDTHPARCTQVIDLGTHHDEKYNKKVHKIRIGWEFPTELHTFHEEKGPEPFVLGRSYNLSLHEDSGLYALLVAWRGRKFTDEELKGFNIGKLIGAPCMVTVVHEEHKGKVRANVNAVTKLPKGMVCPAAILKPVIYEVEQGPNATFEALPEWIKEQIRECLEWKAEEPAPLPNTARVTDDSDSDIPF